MAESKLSISVAMCTYNGEKYLHEQLQSIAAQTRLPDELVVCDDGSSDATADIVEEFSRSAAFPVHFVRNREKLGSTRNFEKAIDLCTGDLIALSDQDDIWLQGRLARQAMMMEQDPALGGIFTDAELMDDRSHRVGKRLWQSISFTVKEQQRVKKGQGFTILAKKNVVTGATFMVRANLRSAYLPIPDTWGHEAWIAWMLEVYSKLQLIEEPLIQYRIHASQQVGIRSFSEALPPTLRERLEKGKREEPAKHRLHAQYLIEVDRGLAKCNKPKSAVVLHFLRRAIRFYEDRGRFYTRRREHVGNILSNAANYRRYEFEDGWKCFVRELIIAGL